MAEKRATKRKKDDNQPELNESSKKISLSADKSVKLSGCKIKKSDDSTTVKSLDSSWSCESCTLTNNKDSKTCELCDRSRPLEKEIVGGDNKNSKLTKSVKLNHSSESQSSTDKQDQQNESLGWTCSECTAMNANELEYCAVCDSPKNLLESLSSELNQCHNLIRELQQAVSNKGEGIKYPEHWSGAMENKGFTRVNLPADHSEYKLVIKTAGAGLKPYIKNIVSIQRIENWPMYQIFAQMKETMIKKNGTKTNNERWLWHGSDDKALESICSYGFNQNYAGIKNHSTHGSGTYLATDITTSLAYANARMGWIGYKATPIEAKSTYKLLMCRVLTGQFTVGTYGAIELPSKKDGGRYDSVTDNITNPYMFIIFQDYQAYPEYEITFHN